MATFAQRYTVAIDGPFQARVGIALARIAYAVLDETIPNKPGLNRKRWDMAWAVLTNPVEVAQRFALLAAAQDVPATEPDESLEALIRQGFDVVAGVTPADRG